MSDDENPAYQWTCLGREKFSWGPWRYQVFPSEEKVMEKFRLFANPETDATAGVTSVTIQPCLNEDYSNEDRRVVQSWNMLNGRWTFVGVFDGHIGHETVDHAVTELPLKVKSQLEALLETTQSTTSDLSPEDVSALLTDTIRAFDVSLLDELSVLFPGGLDGALMLRRDRIEEIINDTDRGGKNMKKLQRCMQGSTVLTALVDPSGENLWVASLGDCEAVLGTKSTDGTWNATLITSNHNGFNEAEVHRIREEHPGENYCMLRGRVLGGLAVTRALGDYVFKLPAWFTHSVCQAATSTVIDESQLDDWMSLNSTPPYLSNCPDVHHHQLPGRRTDNEVNATIPNSFLIMCSDGLTAVYPKEVNNINHWVQVVGSAMERGESTALALLWQALGGNADIVSQYITLESTKKWIDDITIAVLKL